MNQIIHLPSSLAKLKSIAFFDLQASAAIMDLRSER